MDRDSLNAKIVAGFEKLLREIDQDQVARDVAAMRAEHPTLGTTEIATKMVRSAALKAASTGAVAGGFGGPIAMLAMVPDIFNLVRQQSRLILSIAMLHGKEPNHPDRIREVMATLAISTGATASRHGITFLLQKGLGSEVAYRIAKKIAGRFIARKLPTLAPVAGGAIGGAVNYLAVRSVGRLALKYYGGTEAAV